MFQLYNMEADQARRFAIFKKICQYARDAKLGVLVDPLARHVEENYTTWGSTPPSLARSSTTSPPCSPRPRAASIPMVRRGEACARRAPQVPLNVQGGRQAGAQGEEVATAAVVSFIQAKDMMFRCDILGYPAVQALKGTKSEPVLKLLTTLLTSDGLSESPPLPSPTAPLFKSLGIDENECAGKMKLLALCALSEKCVGTGGEVTYAQVAEVLSCGADEVEGWIVAAPSARGSWRRRWTRCARGGDHQGHPPRVRRRAVEGARGEHSDLAGQCGWHGQGCGEVAQSGNATLTKESIAAH